MAVCQIGNALYVVHIDWCDVAHPSRVNTFMPPASRQSGVGFEQLCACIKYEVIMSCISRAVIVIAHRYWGYEMSYETADAPFGSTSSTVISKGLNSTLSKSSQFHVFNGAPCLLASLLFVIIVFSIPPASLNFSGFLLQWLLMDKPPSLPSKGPVMSPCVL